MEKVELFDMHQRFDWYNEHVWDEWFEWRAEKAGIVYKEDEEKWYELLKTMPDIFAWYPDTKTNEMVLKWEDKEERVPLIRFYDDESEQPDLECLWHCNYYDGPLSGMAKFNGEHVWFDLIKEDDHGMRTFGIYRLSVDDRDYAIASHLEFQECVGYHCDHDPKVHQPFVMKDKKKFDRFYKRSKKDKRQLNKDGNLLFEARWYQFKNWARPR